MDISDDMGVSKLSAKGFFWKVNFGENEIDETIWEQKCIMT